MCIYTYIQDVTSIYLVLLEVICGSPFVHEPGNPPWGTTHAGRSPLQTLKRINELLNPPSSLQPTQTPKLQTEMGTVAEVAVAASAELGDRLGPKALQRLL